MKTRNSALYALGLAAAITLGGCITTAEAQQDTTRKATTAQQRRRTTARRRAASQRRIPVRKDVPAPVAAKADTITITRVDTVTVRRTDTVATTVTRYDTVTRMVYPPLQRLPGFFIGLGAGANIPMNNIRIAFKDSYAGQVQLGYFPLNSPLGIRGDATFGRISRRETVCPTCASPTVWTVGGDVIFRIPLDRSSKLNPVIYAFGGGGWQNVGTITRPQQLVNKGGSPNKQIDMTGGHAYWDVGPGVDFSLGGLHLYAEGRYMTIYTKAFSPQSQNTTAHMFPVYGGIKLY